MDKGLPPLELRLCVALRASAALRPGLLRIKGLLPLRPWEIPNDV
ncbi:hypothetical protein HMPREF9554_01064 [Treponema phagedenis F0421]|nr:hypothetical protein HMPREF9554_01064 [Treponema phagedenis F0421]